MDFIQVAEKYGILVDKDIMVPMRDGVRIAVDVYRPKKHSKFPALVAYGPYGKELQQYSLTLAPQRRPSPLWNGAIEAGDTKYIISHDYVHVIADARGTGKSEGIFYGFMGGGSGWEGKDCYDLIEWVAKQPWCNGNVGMVGISYYSSVQILAAAENPPHLKAIFCNGGHYDVYEFFYHGGILWMMPRAAIEGRGGDSGIAWGNLKSVMKMRLSEEQFWQKIKERMEDPDIQHYPDLYHVLTYPDSHLVYIDFLLNPLDGPFYRDGEGITKCHKINIPVYLSVKLGRGWTVESTIECFQRIKSFTMLEIQPPPPMQERPFHEFHDMMIRWYDYWLKGIDTGITKEPPIKIYVDGAKKWRHETEWPIPGTEWVKFYLRTHGRLSKDPETLSSEFVPPEGFYQPPLSVTNEVRNLRWSSEPLDDDFEAIGPGAVYLYATIDTDDTNFIVRLYDRDPYGSKTLVTIGYLKASHREIDESKSTPWRPYHPHERAIPVIPWKIEIYAINLYTMSHCFKKGHFIELELSSIEPVEDPAIAKLPPEGFHLPSGRATTHKIYRDRAHPSYLILPHIR